MFQHTCNLKIKLTKTSHILLFKSLIFNYFTAIPKQVIQLILIILVGTDVCVRMVFVWEETGVPGGNPLLWYRVVIGSFAFGNIEQDKEGAVMVTCYYLANVHVLIYHAINNTLTPSIQLITVTICQVKDSSSLHEYNYIYWRPAKWRRRMCKICRFHSMSPKLECQKSIARMSVQNRSVVVSYCLCMLWN